MLAVQKQEGWLLRPDRFDDSGVSGGTLEEKVLESNLLVLQVIDFVIIYFLGSSNPDGGSGCLLLHLELKQRKCGTLRWRQRRAASTPSWRGEAISLARLREPQVLEVPAFFRRNRRAETGPP